jgi:hypothetical protein
MAFFRRRSCFKTFSCIRKLDTDSTEQFCESKNVVTWRFAQRNVSVPVCRVTPEGTLVRSGFVDASGTVLQQATSRSVTQHGLAFEPN